MTLLEFNVLVILEGLRENEKVALRGLSAQALLAMAGMKVT